MTVFTRVSPDGIGRVPLLTHAACCAETAPQWIDERRDEINATLLQHGAILFRGLGITDALAFQSLVRSLGDSAIDYTYRSTPRTKIVNLLGAIHCARAASTHLLRANRGGRIINMSSIVGSRGYNGLSAYSASKAGLDGLTRSLARELGRRKITVNSIAPGYVRTELSDTLSAQQLDQIVGRTPIGRLPTSQDVLGVIRFLLSDAAQMITGQSILVDGGLSC